MITRRGFRCCNISVYSCSSIIIHKTAVQIAFNGYISKVIINIAIYIVPYSYITGFLGFFIISNSNVSIYIFTDSNGSTVFRCNICFYVVSDFYGCVICTDLFVCTWRNINRTIYSDV